MGTLVHVSARGRSRAQVQCAMDAAFAAIELVDRLMSFHAADSELTRLNRHAARRAHKVHPWTYAVLRRALRLAAHSNGLFDVAVGADLVREGLLPCPDLPGPSPTATWRDIRLLPHHRVAYARPMLMDLGGIAKGFAVDRAIHALLRAGCIRGTVNAGGDLRRYGPQPELIHVRWRDAALPLAYLRCGAIATSGPSTVLPGRLAQPIGHIVDPRSRGLWPSDGAVSVAAPTCTLADALTKIAALAGPACQPLLARFGAQALWWDAGHRTGVEHRLGPPPPQRAAPAAIL
jgi:thiamine biosynthesis lipoprotein